MGSFKDWKILITGGSSGIGKEIAREFLTLGAHVTIMADQAAKLESARVELSTVSASISALLCDIADLDQVRKTAAKYVERWGAPHVLLVNNAGFAVYRAFEEMDGAEIDRLLRVNFVGACLVTRELLPAMIRSGRGHVVIMSSIAGRLPMTPCGVYSAAKHGLVAWAETLRAEMYRHGIQVHAICPGRVETPFFEHETFAKRAPRREARSAIPVEAVARATVQAVRSGQFLAYRPKWHRWLVWFAHSVPLLSRPALQYLMRARVASLDVSSSTGGSGRS